MIVSHVFNMIDYHINSITRLGVTLRRRCGAPVRGSQYRDQRKHEPKSTTEAARLAADVDAVITGSSSI